MFGEIALSFPKNKKDLPLKWNKLNRRKTNPLSRIVVNVHQKYMAYIFISIV